MFIGTYSVTTTLASAFTHVKKKGNVAPLNRPRALYWPPPRGVGMHHMLATYPPHPAWFPPKRGLACSATLHHTPVGPNSPVLVLSILPRTRLSLPCSPTLGADSRWTFGRGSCTPCAPKPSSPLSICTRRHCLFSTIPFACTPCYSVFYHQIAFPPSPHPIAHPHLQPDRCSELVGPFP